MHCILLLCKASYGAYGKCQTYILLSYNKFLETGPLKSCRKAYVRLTLFMAFKVKLYCQFYSFQVGRRGMTISKGVKV